MVDVAAFGKGYYDGTIDGTSVEPTWQLVDVPLLETAPTRIVVGSAQALMPAKQIAMLMLFQKRQEASKASKTGVTAAEARIAVHLRIGGNGANLTTESSCACSQGYEDGFVLNLSKWEGGKWNDVGEEYHHAVGLSRSLRCRGLGYSSDTTIDSYCAGFLGWLPCCTRDRLVKSLCNVYQCISSSCTV